MKNGCFFKRFSSRKVHNAYDFSNLDKAVQEKPAQAEELTVRENKKETDDSAHRIINSNHLRQALKEHTVCRKCVEKGETDIMRNVVDEFSKKLELSLGINIPDNIKQQYKEEYKSLHQKKTMPGIQLKERHCGIATSFRLNCSHLDHCYEIEPEKSCLHRTKREGKRSAAERLSWYALNNKLVLANLQNGGGCTEAATTLGFLDLPRALSIGNQGFHRIEMEIGKMLRDFAKEAMEYALMEEIKLTLEAEMREWNLSPHPKKTTYLF